MDISIYDRLRPYLSNIIAAVIVPLLAWVAEKTGIGWFADPEFVESVKQVAVVWVGLVITKTIINKRVNPGNTSSAHLARASANERRYLTDDIHNPAKRTHVAGSDPDRDRSGIL